MPESSSSPQSVEAHDPAGPFGLVALTPERRDAIIEDLARKVVARRLETPAIFFLEMNKPLAVVASTVVTFAQPTLGAFFGYGKMAEWAALLQERQNVERLIERIESLHEERTKSGNALGCRGEDSHAGH